MYAHRNNYFSGGYDHVFRISFCFAVVRYCPLVTAGCSSSSNSSSTCSHTCMHTRTHVQIPRLLPSGHWRLPSSRELHTL
jgi:hypothetical protein